MSQLNNTLINERTNEVNWLVSAGVVEFGGVIWG